MHIRPAVLVVLVISSAVTLYAFLDLPWYVADGAGRVSSIFELPSDGDAHLLVEQRTQRSVVLWALFALTVLAALATATRHGAVALAARITVAVLGSLMVLWIAAWTALIVCAARDAWPDTAGTHLAPGYWVTIAALAVLTVGGGVGLRRDGSRHPAPTGPAA